MDCVGNVSLEFVLPKSDSDLWNEKECKTRLAILGLQHQNENARFENFAEAEKIMMEDAPIIVLWYQFNYTLYHSEIRNFYYNPIDYFDFTEVYIKTLCQLPYRSEV